MICVLLPAADVKALLAGEPSVAVYNDLLRAIEVDERLRFDDSPKAVLLKYEAGTLNVSAVVYTNEEVADLAWEQLQLHLQSEARMRAMPPSRKGKRQQKHGAAG